MKFTACIFIIGIASLLMLGNGCSHGSNIAVVNPGSDSLTIELAFRTHLPYNQRNLFTAPYGEKTPEHWVRIAPDDTLKEAPQMIRIPARSMLVLFGVEWDEDNEPAMFPIRLLTISGNHGSIHLDRSTVSLVFSRKSSSLYQFTYVPKEDFPLDLIIHDS